jgi:hypothetical protein
MQQKALLFATETFSCTEAFKSRIPGNAKLQLSIKRGYCVKAGLTKLLSKVYVVMSVPSEKISEPQAFKSRKRRSNAAW